MNNDFNMGFPSDTVSRTCHFKHDTFLIRNPWYYFPLYPLQKQVQKFFFNPSAKVRVCCFLFFNSLLFNPQAASENENVFFFKSIFEKMKPTQQENSLWKKQTRLTALPFFPQNGPWTDVQKLFVFENPFLNGTRFFSPKFDPAFLTPLHWMRNRNKQSFFPLFSIWQEIIYSTQSTVSIRT